MSKHSMVCAGIDTGKRKLDVSMEPQRLQVAEGHTALSAWLRQRGSSEWDRGERRLRTGGGPTCGAGLW